MSPVSLNDLIVHHQPHPTYQSFLSSIHFVCFSQIHVQSTDYDRTLMSAYCNLAGLYPPSGQQVWNRNITWQPIPVHTVPKDMDDVSHVDSWFEFTSRIFYTSNKLMQKFGLMKYFNFQLLYTDAKCPKYDEVYQKVLHSEEIRKEEQDNKVSFSCSQYDYKIFIIHYYSFLLFIIHYYYSLLLS